MTGSSLFLSSMGIVCSLGWGQKEVLGNLLNGKTEYMTRDTTLVSGQCLRFGKVNESLPYIKESALVNSRNNQLLVAALEEVLPEIERLKMKYGVDRIGVILATSTSGTLEAEAAMSARISEGVFPADYHFRTQEMGDPGRFLAHYLEVTGPCYTVSTACSSSGKVFASARNLIRSGLCDAVIVGGADSLCKLTATGFSALESVSAELCNPFSVNRNGINLGEGAALFTLTSEPADIALLGLGESSDAWHISAPHPEGRGAVLAMSKALSDSGLSADNIGYLNLHGTATPLNDAMESQAVEHVLGSNTLCGSTKPLTGHTLGAAGSVEAALGWLLLSPLNDKRQLPPHIWDGEVDPDLPALRLTKQGDVFENDKAAVMSNSFAFGGSNVSLILGRCCSD